MKSDRLKLARRPAPSGRVAHSAGVLPARDCIARRIESEWFAVRGFAVPVRYARPGSPPTAGNHRIRVDALTKTESQSHRQTKRLTGAFFRAHALLLTKVRLWRSRNFRATFMRYSRNGRKLPNHFHGLSTTTNLRRSFHVHELSTVFPQSRIVSVLVPFATMNQPRPVHRLSEERPRSGHWFPHLQYVRCLNGFITVSLFEWSLPLARVVCVLVFRPPVAARQSLAVRRTVLFAFRMASLASSKVRPNLSGGVVLSVVAGLLYRHSGRRAGLHFVFFAQSSGIQMLAVVGPWLVCPLRRWSSVAVIQRLSTFAQSESERE